MRYKIIRGLTGTSVKYACEKCKTDLRSPLSDAGKTDACPDCGEAFTVPGVRELERHQQAQEKRKRDKAEAKEQRRREREEQAALRAQQERQAREAEAARKREAVNRANEKARQRDAVLHNALHGSMLDLSKHDWSTGGPWVYDCVAMGTLSSNWQSSLSSVINDKAREGWEYYRSESLVATRPAGCLAFFLGRTTEHYHVVVLVFRRPAEVVQKENAVRASFQ